MIPSPLFPVSILCVDDEPANLDILTRHLTGRVTSLTVAADGMQGYAMFLDKRPDIVLTDLMMPGIDGLEMSRMIRAVAPGVPIILLTSCNSADFLAEAIDTGISQFLPKPVLKEKLLTAMQRCFDTIDLERRLNKERERNLLLSSAMEQSPTAFVILDAYGTVEHLNLACQQHYGWTPENMTGHELLAIDASPDLHRLLDTALATARSNSGEVEVVALDGTVVLTLAKITPFGAVGGHQKYLLSLEDIAEKKITETHLQRTQKLESLAVLAGGVAHNFNNILTAVIGDAAVALMRLPEDSPAVKFVQNIESSAARAAAIAKQMLDYSGRGSGMLSLLNLNSLLEEMQGILAVVVPDGIDLCLATADVIPLIKGDAVQLRQVIVNLVINAVEAIEEGSKGIIRVATGCMACTPAYIASFWFNNDIRAGEYAFIEVSDTGCGMDKDIIARLFDPFFSTKFTGRGLGMAAVMGIVRWHNGAIYLVSKPGVGSSFKIFLPVIPAAGANTTGGGYA